MTKITSFAGIDTPAFFNIKKVTFSALPPVQIQTLDVPSRNGEYYVGRTFGANTITAEFFIEAPDRDSVMYIAEMLGAWLHTDEPQPLIFSDKPDRTYYAIVKDATPIEKALEFGTGTISFYLPDPCSYGPTSILPIARNTPVSIINNGTAEMFPKFTVNFLKSSSYLTIASPDGIVLLGNPKTPEKTTIPKYKTVLSEDMSAVSRWAASNSSQVDGDTVQGSFVSNGYSFQVTDFGTKPTSGNGWYGPAMRRDLSETAQDFELVMKVGLSSDAIDQMGRIEVYGYDINGVRLFKMQVKDAASSYENTVIEGWVGDGRQSQVGYQAMYIEGRIPRPKLTTQKDKNGKVTKKYIYPTNIGIYNDLRGFLRINRQGTKYMFQVGRYNSTTGKEDTRTTKFYTDSKKKYAQGALAYVVVHMGKYGDQPTPKSAFYIDDIKVTKLQSGGTTYNEDIINAGDVIEVDMATGEVLRNGGDFLENLDIASTFFSIEGGTETQVQVLSEDTTMTINAEVQERYL
ncbi:distal tail protein Dit [Priestia megaterium]|uniref:distal tail protein Dit n=1 Tax=Priestia megaterium TaxID=1404 RepID=UPI002FFE5587